MVGIAALVATSGLLVGRKFPVQHRLSIGRAAGNDIQLASAEVSRQHALIQSCGEEFTLTDMRSRNGTRVNGRLIHSCLLRHGDRITIDEFGFDFFIEGSLSRKEVTASAKVVDLPESEQTLAAEIDVDSASSSSFEKKRVTPVDLDLYRRGYQILIEASQAFGLESDLHSLFEKILACLFELIPAHRGVIFIRNEDTTGFHPVAQKARASGPGEEIEVSRTLLLRAADTKKAILATNAATDARFQGSQSISLHNIRSAMCMPMVHDSELQGIVYLDTIGIVERFDSQGLELLAALSGPAAIAVKNARFLTKLNLRSRQLEESYYDTLKVIVTSLEMRDHYTIGHGRRVALFAGIVAEEMGWAQDRLKVVEMGSLVHDLGKIGIEDSILRKRDKLSESEMEQMRFHPEIGARIVRDVDFLESVVPFVLYHHERYDGAGHPHHLKGEDIPIEGRLLAVADAFDAMTSDRPYRKAMDVDQAIRIIRQETGRQFDPQVVDAFLNAWKKGRITKAMLSSAPSGKMLECPYCSSPIRVHPDSGDARLVCCPECHRRARL